MKKIIAAVLAISMLLCSVGFAAQIKPVAPVDMAGDLNNSTLRVSFVPDVLSDTALIADIYEEMRYDAVEVGQLAVGDTILYLGEEIAVETIEDDYSRLINGGCEAENGITLCPDEGGTYVALDYETPAYLMVGQAEFPLAETVALSYWQEGEDGSILDEMINETVAAADLKAALTARFDYADVFTASETTITVEEGFITAVTINYIP